MGVPHFSLSSPSLAITIFIFLIFSFPSACSSLSFEVENNFRLFGDAQFTKDSITLTQEYNHLQPPPVPSFPTKGVGNGRALYKHPIRLLDRATNKTASFLCRFSFSITTSPAYPCGDGLAFLMTSNATSVNNASSFGLPLREKGSKESFFAVEFDTSFDPNLGDVNDNHIGVDLGTVVSFASVGVDHMGINLKNGRLITAWIQYEGDTKMLHVWVSHSPEAKPREPVISTNIDLLLKTEFKEFMYVGFSASNRPYGFSRHVVQSWQFTSFGLVSPETLTGVMGDGGNGCSTCLRLHEAFSVSDGFIRSEPKQEAQKLGKMAAGLGGVAAALLLVCAAVIMALRFWRATRAATSPSAITLATIRLATEQFNVTNRLAHGASADIYKGSLDSKVVAFKRFQMGNGAEEPPRTLYDRERIAMLRCGFHLNIIILLGWCDEEDEHGNGELVLVYEWLHNGSLADFLDNSLLSDRRWVSPRNWLNWRRRRNIAIGLASALAYLHDGCGEDQVIHRDLKPANLLLDAEFNAILADFGLAEVYARAEDINERLPVLAPGTRHYTDPQFLRDSIPRDFNDVYSFGIVALEIATGQPPADLADIVWKKRTAHKLMEAADSRLKGCYFRSEMKTLLLVGLLCTFPHRDQRPRMREVERMLRANRVSRQVPYSKPVLESHPLPELAPDEQQGDVNPDQAALRKTTLRRQSWP